MKIWKVLNRFCIVAYVYVSDNCTVFDTGYAALQLVRKKIPNDKTINGIQLLDIERNEKIIKGVPIYSL